MSLLADPAFRRYWIGTTVSLVGDYVTLVALPLTAVVALHAGPLTLGTLTALAWLPSLLLGIPAGAWADRQPSPRRVMLAADLARSLVLRSIPAAALLGMLSLPQLFAVALMVGALSVAADVAAPALFVRLVSPAGSVVGGQLIHGSRAGAALVGQALGGSLVALLTGPGALVLDVVSYVLSALALRRVPDGNPSVDADRPRGRLGDGLTQVLREPVLRLLLASAMNLNAFMVMATALLPLFATRVLGLGPAQLGTALAVGALGGVAGAALAGPISRRLGTAPLLALGALLYPLPFALLAGARGGGGAYAWAALAAAELVSSVGVLLYDVGCGAVTACAVPLAAQSRVAGAFQAANYGVRPVAALAGGALGTWLGLRALFLVAALGGAMSAVWVLRPPLWWFRVPAPAAAEQNLGPRGHRQEAPAVL